MLITYHFLCFSFGKWFVFTGSIFANEFVIALWLITQNIHEYVCTTTVTNRVTWIGATGKRKFGRKDMYT